MWPSAGLLPDLRRPRDECTASLTAFLAAIPSFVDGGAHVVAVHRYRPADEDGPASATVLAHWGADDELPEWGTHVLSWEADLGRHLLWRARYFADLPTAWADLTERMPTWRVVPHDPLRRSPTQAVCRALRVRR